MSTASRLAATIIPDQAWQLPPLPNRVRASALDLAMYQVGSVHDGQCRCVITFGGRLDEELLADAVTLSLHAAPILACHFVPRPWRSRWELCAQDANVICSRVEGVGTQSEIDRFLNAALDPLQGPPVRVHLIRSTCDVLCIKLHHMVADAGGLLAYVRLLGSLYAQLEGPAQRVDLPPVGDRGLGQVLRGAGLGAVIRGWANFRLRRAQWEVPHTGSGLSGRAFPMRVVGPARYLAMKAWCQAKEVRFSDALLTAYHRALSRVLAPAPGALLPVEVTIDLRRYVPAGRSAAVADLTGASFPAIRCVPGEDYEQTLARLEAAVAAVRGTWLGTTLLFQVLTQLPASLQRMVARLLLGRYFSGMVSPTLSNLGALQRTAFSFGEMEAADVALFGPVMFPPHFVATVYTMDDQLRINTSICDTAMDPAVADAVLDAFVAELPA